MNGTDSRIPVVFATPAEAGPQDALLLDGDAAAPAGRVVGRVGSGVFAHAPGCNCCVSRSGAAAAMAALFIARSRGEVAFFPRLVVALGPAGRAAAQAALAQDRFVAARYRAVSRTSPDRAAAGVRPGSAWG